MNGLSICSGIGGLDLGLSRLVSGYRTVCYLEREVYAAAVLVGQMEEGRLDTAPVWDDLATFDGRPWRGVVDLVHAGLPCQPYSVAGKRRGDEDERYIWDDFFRIVREVQPALVFLENVPGLLAWFQPIGEELSSMGFEFEAGLFSAEEVGASHKRERLFILGNADLTGSQGRQLRSESMPTGCELPAWPPGPSDPRWADIIQRRPDLAPAVAYAECGRRGQRNNSQGRRSESQDAFESEASIREGQATEPEVRGMDDGLRDWMDRVNENRVDRLRGLGNAVVPQCAAKAFMILRERIIVRSGSAKGLGKDLERRP